MWSSGIRPQSIAVLLNQNIHHCGRGSSSPLFTQRPIIPSYSSHPQVQNPLFTQTRPIIASSHPRPARYGKGSVIATVTDSDIVTGWMEPGVTSNNLLSFYFQFPCILLTTIWLGTFQKLVWSEKTRRSNVRKSIILPLTIWNQVKTWGWGWQEGDCISLSKLPKLFVLCFNMRDT